MALKLITAGESHGPGLTCIVEGLPAGLVLDRQAIDRDMARRQLGHGRGGRMKIEKDHADITAIAAATVAQHYIGLLAMRRRRDAVSGL